MIVENEKVFEYFTVLPAEVRMMIVDEMKADDRCRFTRCSKLSQKEARSSKNYIYALSLRAYYENIIRIHIIHGNYNEEIDGYDKMSSYKIVFEAKDDEKLMRCELINEKRLWEEKLDKSIDLVECAADYFKELLRLYQGKIKNLHFEGFLYEDKLKNYDFGVKNLRNLRELKLESSMNIPEYFSKLRNPLKVLIVQGFVDREDITNCDEVYEVRDKFFMINTKFTNEQMLRLTAPIICFHIGKLTVMDIYNYIRSWQNGTIQNKKRWHTFWNMMNSSFDATRLFRMLGVIKDEESPKDMHTFEIKHLKEAGKSAKLNYINSRYQKELVFYSDRPEE